uniref:ubiquitinyl hydrolase 1 n=1 Tax=Salix viminalis TaxID=40686 RepID=A0A6N2LA52_SALVM
MTENNSNASVSSTSSLNSSIPDTEDDHTIASILAEGNSQGRLGKRLSHLDSVPHTPRVNSEIPDVNDATLDHERLSIRLATYGLEELHMEGDGNCQFRALADQLFRSPDYHKHARKQVVKQLKHHRKLYEGYVPMKYRSYVKKMKKLGEWGDHVTLQAAADRFGAKICVLTSFRDTCYIEIFPKDMSPTREIWLSFWSEVHYNSLYANGVPSESAVSSIDLGSEWIKVAVVNLKPGQTPISIAINEMSKRKTPALVAFQSGTRLLGEEASGIAARYPDKVYSHLRDMLGKSYEKVKGFLEAMYLPYDVVKDSRGAAAFRVEDGDGNVGLYSVEELLGMILGFAGDLAEFHSKVVVKDAVIGVPAYFGQTERRGLVQAAQLAGINVLALINEHSGAALQYGIDKDFSNGSRYVVFYDMGASSTYAALVYFSAYNAKEFGKTVSVNQFQEVVDPKTKYLTERLCCGHSSYIKFVIMVKDVRWDPELGGQTMESRLVEYFADEFNKQVGNGVDVRKFPKAMAKLKKQVKRTKEILSANTAAPISVESLYDDRDFRSTITREKFEELCADLWDRSLVPVKEVLKHSGLNLDELYAIELIGGATRVPKLQAKLQEFLGKNELDKHLDADEAVVLGSSLHAANLSDGIKLNRKLGMVDGSSYGLVVELDGPDLLKDESTRQLLVPRMKKLPSKMFRSIIHMKDFEVSLSYEPDLLPPGVTSPVFAQYSVSGLTDASEKYSSRNLSSPIKANLHFSLSRSGSLSLDRADAVIEISEWVEVPKKNLTVENTTTTSPNITLETDTKNTTEENDEKLNSDGVTDNTSIDVTQEASTTEPVTEKKLKKRTFRIPLKIVEKTAGPGMPLSEEYLAQAKRKLEELNKKDAERRRTAELKNNLEGYIYSTKEKVQEWLYTDGEDATAKEFQERLDSLKASGDPIFFRYKELSARPAAIELARKYLGELQQVVSDGDKLKSWLDEKEAEQKKASGFSTPVLTSEEIYLKVLNLQDKVASANRIPKPKPKIEKPKKNKTETSGDNMNSDDSTAEETPEKEKQADSDGSAGEKTNPEGSADEKTNPEPEAHDEL